MPKKSTVAAISYVALAAADTALAARPGRKARAARFVTKPLLMPVLATAFVDATEGKGKLARRTAAAQAFSWGGDVALLGKSDNAFLAGLSSFFAGHLGYVAAFASARDKCNPLDNKGVRAAGAMALTTAPVMALAAGRRNERLRAPVAAYSMILSSMFAASAMLDPQLPTRARRTIMAGSGLFLLSDTILGTREFLVKGDSHRLDAAVMATYTAGQGLIALGVAQASTGPGDAWHDAGKSGASGARARVTGDTFHMRRTVLATALVAGLFTAPQPAIHAAAVECFTVVTGVVPSGKIVYRELVNGGVLSTHLSDEALPVKPTSLTWDGWVPVEGGHEAGFTVYSPGTRPRFMRASLATGGDDFSFTTAETHVRAFGPRLAASSGTYYVYGVDKAGNLNQWTRYRSVSDRLYLANPKLVARGMKGLKTLVFNTWAKTSKGKIDVLYGTTGAGALLQFQVPWRKPGQARKTAVTKTGFANATGLSTAVCNNDNEHVSVIAVDRKNSRATWFTMKNQLAPSGKRLVRHGRIAKQADWRISAVA